ncbi:hypothetical protein HanXRQr2_Chr12g0544581 [Helianthus annuus]|uniref:Uncharacterized protein n=1 Tax=Helianthus annuus TaxID=4232 RepID=A0A251T3M6_HELAN|nr:hypothetical protein HanXRQr2_Chr12g0544581 [Helianthus annuus]KAJ0862952.1 hypothetical protein HanPSC8_Chr12g0524251 [Helianthus annuus]
MYNSHCISCMTHLSMKYQSHSMKYYSFSLYCFHLIISAIRLVSQHVISTRVLS